MAKSRTAAPTSSFPEDRENYLVVRALHDASKHHLDHYDGDTDLGHEMQALLAARHPDAARALAEADNLRRALEAGFLPPPGGITPDAVMEFLNAHSAKKKTKARYSLGDSDLPF